MKVLIIILNYNSQKNILICLNSFKKLEIGNWKLKTVVVDNASSDASVEAVKKNFPNIKIICNYKNLGFAEGNNVGIRWGIKENYDYFLLLNNDTLVKKDFLIQLLKLIQKNKKTGIVSPKIYFAPGYEYHKKRYKNSDQGKVIWYAGGIIDWDNVLASHRGVDEVDRGQFDKAGETDFSTGCCCLIKREVFKKIGFFDKKYFLYWEDVDLCQRAKKAGFKILYIPKAIVWHKNAESSAVGSQLHDYYLSRNRLLFGFKYTSLRVKISLIRESVKLLRKGRQGQKAGIKDFFLCHFGKR